MVDYSLPRQWDTAMMARLLIKTVVNSSSHSPSLILCLDKTGKHAHNDRRQLMAISSHADISRNAWWKNVAKMHWEDRGLVLGVLAGHAHLDMLSRAQVSAYILNCSNMITTA